jgi:hypothetical protein
MGWHGGGLGRPDGWTGDVWEPPRRAERGISEQVQGESEESEDDVVELDENGEPVIDFTRSEGAATPDMSETREPTPPQGPGRTAPIATVLKVDKLGLGHRLSKVPLKTKQSSTRSHTFTGATAKQPQHQQQGRASGREGQDGRKRVTHGVEEIKEAHRRARMGAARARVGADGSGNGQRGGQAEMGWKGKVKWGKRDKEEREERKRMLAAMNA